MITEGFALFMLRGLIASHLGWEANGVYQLPEYNLKEMDLEEFAGMLERANAEIPENIWDMNFIDLQEITLHKIVDQEISKLRLYALEKHPNHQIHMTHRDLLAAAEIAKIGG